MKKIIVSLGGSLVVPKRDFLATKYLLKLRNLILKYSKGRKFFIIVGGGRVARFYQNEARKVKVTQKNLDWIGIFASRLNSVFVKSFFDKKAYPEIITNPTEKKKMKEKIAFAAGWKPGWSTDFVSVILAKTYGIKEILNLTNVDYIYDKDPKRFKNAKPFKKLFWSDYLKIIGKKWIPGVSYPFDPIASLLAKKLKIRLVSINGKNLKSVENYLTGEEFKGTIIET